MDQKQDRTLLQWLESCLPVDKQFQVLQLQSSPAQTHPIVTPRSKSEKSSTNVKVQHFFSLFYQEKVVFALEIYVFLTLNNDDNHVPAERLIFVSKADTNGYCDIKISFKSLTKALIQYILSINPNYYLQKVKPRNRDYNQELELLTHRTDTIKSLKILSQRSRSSTAPQTIPKDFYLKLKFPPEYVNKICLFTRPEPQYLFAESSQNPQKHYLDGSQLLKWWLSILDDVLCQNFQLSAQARLQIPGEDSSQIKRHLRNTRFTNWHVGDIFGHYPGDLAAFTIPLFPDDPKTRFLRQLVEEDRINTTNLESFWIELAQRQEFRLSVIVSVMGIEGELLQSPLHWPAFPSPEDEGEIFITESKKQFTYIKSYITGEDYGTEDGAFEAFANIRDFFQIRLNRSLLSIKGAKKPTLTTADWSQVDIPNNKRVNVLTTLHTRKKIKK